MPNTPLDPVLLRSDDARGVTTPDAEPTVGLQRPQ